MEVYYSQIPDKYALFFGLFRGFQPFPVGPLAAGIPAVFRVRTGHEKPLSAAGALLSVAPAMVAIALPCHLKQEFFCQHLDLMRYG
jgi:hypothetical protein